AVFLDVYVARSAFVDGSDAIVGSISDASKAEAAISGRACSGTARRTWLPFPRHHESAIPDPKDSSVGRALRVRPDQCETGDGSGSGGKLSLQISIETAGAVLEEGTVVVAVRQN